jgi:starvation-inducible DNA-binding protein
MATKKTASKTAARAAASKPNGSRSGGTRSSSRRSSPARAGVGTARDGAADRGTYTVPGVSESDAREVTEVLQERLVALLDLTLTLKHVHWNVVGRDFIGVHEMLDPQYAEASRMVDAVAERIATMGGSPNGLAGNIVASRTWDDYGLGLAVVPQHLAELDVAYTGLIGGHRAAIEKVGSLDPITEDLLIGQTAKLEMFQWFVRAHLENGEGEIATAASGRRAASAAG